MTTNKANIFGYILEVGWDIRECENCRKLTSVRQEPEHWREYEIRKWICEMCGHEMEEWL
jgi:hypothetical protein